MKPLSTISKSIEDTAKFAENLLASLTPLQAATVLALSGDLGAGKTAFVKELAGVLGLKKEEVTSPTFVIMKIFEIQSGTFKHLIHIDAYRLESERELEHLGWREIISDPKNLICIEWPEHVEKIIPEDAVTITFEFIDEATREMKIENQKERTH